MRFSHLFWWCACLAVFTGITLVFRRNRTEGAFVMENWFVYLVSHMETDKREFSRFWHENLRKLQLFRRVSILFVAFHWQLKFITIFNGIKLNCKLHILLVLCATICMSYATKGEKGKIVSFDFCWCWFPIRLQCLRNNRTDNVYVQTLFVFESKKSLSLPHNMGPIFATRHPDPPKVHGTSYVISAQDENKNPSSNKTQDCMWVLVNFHAL